MQKELNEKTWKDRLGQWMPQLERPERQVMVDRFNAANHWNADFVIMMILSPALAALGLLQNSIPVVIGAMLVSPLISPLGGSAFGLVQCNFKLFRQSMKVLTYGVAMSIGIAFLFGLLMPYHELTLEIEARGEANLLDLGVALISGMIAAYALARPSVAVTLSGVAIAAALVPPMAVVGIALSHGRMYLVLAAGLLFVTNIVAIILGAASTFMCLRVQRSKTQADTPRWAVRVMMAMSLGVVLLALPLGGAMYKQAGRGQVRPMMYPASQGVRAAVLDWIAQHENMSILILGRASHEPESAIYLYIACAQPISASEVADLIENIQTAYGSKVSVRVVPVQTAWMPQDHDPDEEPDLRLEDPPGLE